MSVTDGQCDYGIDAFESEDRCKHYGTHRYTGDKSLIPKYVRFCVDHAPWGWTSEEETNNDTRT